MAEALTREEAQRQYDLLCAVYEAATECFKFGASFDGIARDRSGGDVRKRCAIAHMTRLLRIHDQKARLQKVKNEGRHVDPERERGLETWRNKLLYEGGHSVQYQQMDVSRQGILDLLKPHGLTRDMLDQFVQLHSL